ncbi:flagellar hook-associated protein FlgL [Pseudorhodoferax sp. Leaf274]|uniref:flagellar hook-associated protein FlgL n=1 Tax=Pseudorhodoferax sp. Leaf274 TaxID=1736318 RepID=UPI000702993D|nr:flagellar hook-associated protein FlgL [Pseudorhodoferax sp. Leaf274]KQP37158.1 flagellar biosynthesis protein FlgL [Pseudorhodoferax sp. Leaf274]
MRIATSQYHMTMSQTLAAAQTRLEKVMQQMSTGQRLLLPSDDPVTAVRLSRMDREQAALAQYRDNIGALSVRLTQNETALDSSLQDMQQVRDLMVWASDGGNTAEDLNAMAGALVSLRDSLYYTANSRDQEGRYLFSGTLSTTATIALDGTAAAGSRYSFAGNDARQQVVVGNNITQSANVSLPELAALLNRLDRAVEQLQTPGIDNNDAGVRAILQDALTGTDEAMASVSGKIAGLGGAQNILSTLDDTHGNVGLAADQARIALSQLDYGEAAIRLTGYQTALQATQKAYVRVAGLSLFSQL